MMYVVTMVLWNYYYYAYIDTLYTLVVCCMHATIHVIVSLELSAITSLRYSSCQVHVICYYTLSLFGGAIITIRSSPIGT